jgi:5,10-methylenetetrahydromethanopterin reductase
MLGLGAALWTLWALGEADARTRRPLTAMVEAIRVVRALLRGEPGIEASVFQVRSDARLDFDRTRSAIPIYVGAVNARMLRAAGALADGVQLGAIVSPGYAHWSWQQIARGASEAGRDPAALDLASNVLLSVDRDARAARDAVRRVLAYYIHRVEPVVLSTSGADLEAARHPLTLGSGLSCSGSRRAWRRGRARRR